MIRPINLIKNKDLQNRICQSVAPSNDLTISPPKLKLHAPKNTKNGPGILLIKFIPTLIQLYWVVLRLRRKQLYLYLGYYL